MHTSREPGPGAGEESPGETGLWKERWGGSQPEIQVQVMAQWLWTIHLTFLASSHQKEEAGAPPLPAVKMVPSRGAGPEQVRESGHDSKAEASRGERQEARESLHARRFIKHLLCARRCSRALGPHREQIKALALMELVPWRGQR